MSEVEARVLTAPISGDGAETPDKGERTLCERFARDLPKLAGQLGTVRGSFRLIEAGTPSAELQP
jgi:hypothetical protein